MNCKDIQESPAAYNLKDRNKTLWQYRCNGTFTVVARPLQRSSTATERPNPVSRPAEHLTLLDSRMSTSIEKVHLVPIFRAAARLLKALCGDQDPTTANQMVSPPLLLWHSNNRHDGLIIAALPPL
ncbi:hypothetical protein HAX54_029995 [Datura stramonium]|uniref:Uncharacterized protein n=1 Tax=Datura stramonium TaxID=4076 RepID=A0ABS8V6Y2_DATST|nr:hypothetical protein [Datura stramonium]